MITFYQDGTWCQTAVWRSYDDMMIPYHAFHQGTINWLTRGCQRRRSAVAPLLWDIDKQWVMLSTCRITTPPPTDQHSCSGSPLSLSMGAISNLSTLCQPWLDTISMVRQRMGRKSIRTLSPVTSFHQNLTKSLTNIISIIEMRLLFLKDKIDWTLTLNQWLIQNRFFKIFETQAFGLVPEELSVWVRMNTSCFNNHCSVPIISLVTLIIFTLKLLSIAPRLHAMSL